MPSFQSAGMPSSALERSITACSRCLGAFARCERPSSAPESASSDQPGRFAQGPEEKCGRRGRTLGFIAVPESEGCAV